MSVELPINQFKRNLAAGKPQIGLWMSFFAHQVVELCAPSGFDWLLLDTEHSPNDPHMVHTQLMAAKGYKSRPGAPGLETDGFRMLPSKSSSARTLEKLGQ